MAVDNVRKNAMKRLAQDLKELEQQPEENVSAAPLEENMFEWHCNFRHDDIIYHLILYLPNKYPYESPSAEFVPAGFRYNSGATMPGKKGTKVCLNIFADFALIHTEWKDQKGLGWSPGYTIQTILMNVVAFLAETQTGENEWQKQTHAHNLKLSKGFKCEDCGHTYNKPYPQLPESSTVKKSKTQPKGPQIVDYMSKEPLKVEKPKGIEDLYGYGLIVSGPTHRPALTTPCEFLKFDSFNSMKKAVGTVHSVLKEELKFFLPLYIHQKHGEEIKATFEDVLTKDIAAIMPKCKANKTPIEEMVIKTIPNLMSATVVEFSKGTQHTSDNSLNGYFALHRLFLWALETYPDLQGIIEKQIQEFIESDKNRTKKACPHIGERLMLLAASHKYKWEDFALAYLSESMRRQVMWYVKEDAKLGMLDTPMEYRLTHTLERTAVSRKLLAFQVLFLDIAMPPDMSRKDLIKSYDDNLGFPTEKMVAKMKESVERINNMKTFVDWYKVLKLKPPSEKELFDGFVKNVEFSIWNDGYNWSFWKTGGGWGEVLRRYKPYTPKEKNAEDDKQAKGKGKAPVKGPSKAKGKFVKQKPMAVSDDEDNDDDKGKKKKRAKEPALKEASSDEEEDEVHPAMAHGRGKGRGVKRAANPANSDIKSDKDGALKDVHMKGRGRGRGKANVIKVEAHSLKNVGGGRGKGGKGGKGGSKAEVVPIQQLKTADRKRGAAQAFGKEVARGGKRKR
ncbi:uncharacterized protein LOC127869059 [Dreissena polymorpha]|uniref:UBC core domain-containing protein n=1 Tax=Dreissena polymorpha TaxID=45954 RepID=A0A9D4MDW1_DREPO|nr:uncharacterized protein LOC127869059 [Dreissena polymorpha]KAH3873657.1 hypothetical protein DPMN_036894 [Dreissena polymorpha]